MKTTRNLVWLWVALLVLAAFPTFWWYLSSIVLVANRDLRKWWVIGVIWWVSLPIAPILLVAALWQVKLPKWASILLRWILVPILVLGLLWTWFLFGALASHR